MNELQVFQYQGREFRATKQDEQPWFIASDVCRALEISDTATALQRLDEDEKGYGFNPYPWRSSAPIDSQ